MRNGRAAAATLHPSHETAATAPPPPPATDSLGQQPEVVPCPWTQQLSVHMGNTPRACLGALIDLLVVTRIRALDTYQVL
jgi:hypothetical protein